MLLLGLGSILTSTFGDRFTNLNIALDQLEKYKIKIVKKSSFYESSSYPNKKDPKFINIVVEVSSNLPPEDLASVLIFIEEKLERKRIKKNEPRTCDIDILDYDRKIIIEKNLKLPHPRMHTRNFVLLPFFEIDRTWIHPLKKIDIKKLLSFIKESDLISVKLI